MDCNFSEKIYESADASFVCRELPRRSPESNKGDFGKTLLIVGSEGLLGAAHLSLSMALRGGAGYISYLGAPALVTELRSAYPEAIYHASDIKDTEKVLAITALQKSVLIGSGSGTSRELYELISALLGGFCGVLIIDADGLNSIAKYAPSVKELFNLSKCKVIITPHPLELSRLSGLSVEDIQSDRVGVARRLADEWGVILLLKGHGTVISDGERVIINTTGSSALAKAGSGDVLSGLIASVSAYTPEPIVAAAISAYLHGAAGDRLALELTEYGVTPSDIPREVMKLLGEILRDE